jgi:DNA ligase-1
MLLSELVATSRRVAATRARSEKVTALAGLLQRLEPDEIEVAVAYLAGQLRQGRIGIGAAAVRTATAGTAAAAEPLLTLAEVDAAFAGIAAATGPGSSGERARLLSALLARATRE